MYAAGGDYPYACYELLIKGADLTLTNECDQDAYGIAITNGSKLGMFLDYSLTPLNKIRSQFHYFYSVTI